MSVQLLDDITIESDETPLNDMANLKLGSACSSCENHKNSLCRCTSLTCGGGRGAKDGRKCTLFPYFWRKTQLNPFVKSIRKTKRNFEVLQPSKLSYISASRGGGVAVLANSSSFSVPSSSSSLSSTSSSSWSSVHRNSGNTNNTSARLIATLPSTEPSQSVITSPSNTTIACDQIIASDSTIPKSTDKLNNLSSSASTTTTTTSSSQCPVVIAENSLLPSTSSSIAATATAFTGSFQPSLSLPDFTSLSIKGLSADNNNSDSGLNSSNSHSRPSIIPDERGENETTRLLLGKRTVTQRQMMTELNGAMLNFRLDSRSSGSSRSSSRSSIKIPKWKSRIRCSYRTKALPPILEDESDPLSSSSTNVNSSPSSVNSPNLNCSQQALMETGGRWNQDSSSVDPVDDITIDELAGYLDVFVYIGSKQMSSMAEMMYT